MSGNNGTNNRLEKKAKMGWAAFFKGQNDNHDSQLRWVSRFNDLKDKLSNVQQQTDIPVHIANELRELYDIAKKEVSCPICLDVLETKNIKFSSCGHKYCAPCLAKLKSQPSSTCAMCRRKIY
tara:strand:- start:51 stop:419 length:369 start_codon:yes stop_codon:yes gene_type:complete